jgi:formylglycine-generating enzyme required for sulfatase activity
MKAILLFLTLILPPPFSYSQNIVALASGNTSGRDKPVSSQVEQNETDSVALPEMILIQGDTFQMGSTEGLNDEKPVHQVILNNYYLGKYEVTVAQFGQFISETGYNDGFIYLAPVGSFNPNEFGLYDMTGNVGEWCGDLYGAKYYKSSPRDDPRGPSEGIYRVIRGGSWRLDPSCQQVAYRDRGNPEYRYHGSGFRIAMSE